MIKLKYFLLCKGASIDERTKTVSAFGLIDQFTATKFPSNAGECTILAQFNRDIKTTNELNEGRVEMMLNGEKIGGATFKLNFMSKKRSRLIITYPYIPLKESGELLIDLYLGKEKISTIDVDVVLKVPEINTP